MNRKRILLLLILTLLLGLTACGGDEPIATGTGPGRMVRRIEIAIHPADDSFTRVYVTQENVSELLTLLRSLSTTDYPETEPDLTSGQTYYTATVTFANGEHSVYYLLSHTYFRMGSDPWCVIGMDQSRRFTDFIRTHPSDDGSMPIETTFPPETTPPTGTSTPTE